MGFLPILLLLAHGLTATSTPQAAAPRSSQTAPLVRVFLDCGHRCDFDYLRTEITFVDWVRDRRDAELHLLITTQPTGGGGIEWVAHAIGLGRFKTVDQQLTFSTDATATPDDQRRALAQTMKLLLVRYAADTEAAKRITVGFQPQAGPSRQGRADPWNYWVIKAGVNGYASGERSNSFVNTYGDISASRITEAWKINTAVEYSYNRSSYLLSDEERYTTISRGSTVVASVAKSIGPRWSLGAAVTAGSSTYLNQDLSFWAAPAVELNVFPYAESTRRRLTFAYLLGYRRYEYQQLTIYDRMSDAFLEHRGTVGLGLRQPWGTLNTVFEGRQQLSHRDRTNLRLNVNTSVRLFKGFQFDVGGNYVRPRDQIYLVKGEATDEEILVRQRQLATSYRYWINFGIRYSFGSVHNNVVNPRFQNVLDF